MKIESTDHLFGTDEFRSMGEFGSPDENSSDKSINADVFTEKSEYTDSFDISSDKAAGEGGTPARITRSMGISGAIKESEREPAPVFTAERAKNFIQELLPRPLLIMGGFLFIMAFVVISVVSLHVKMRKNAFSYELSAQTRMMQRLEKRKAMFELEYSFMRSSQSVTSKVQETGWKEITPQSIKFIKPVLSKGGTP